MTLDLSRIATQWLVTVVLARSTVGCVVPGPIVVLVSTGMRNLLGPQRVRRSLR